MEKDQERLNFIAEKIEILGASYLKNKKRLLADIAKTMKISEPKARKLLKEAEEQVLDIYPDHVKKRLAAAVSNDLLNIKDKALSIEKYGDALKAIDQFTKLHGLNEPEKFEVEGDQEIVVVHEVIHRATNEGDGK